MTDTNKVAKQIQAALADIGQLRPAEERAAYEQVLAQLTDLLNTPDESGPGMA